jgi:hypothetical protein
MKSSSVGGGSANDHPSALAVPQISVSGYDMNSATALFKMVNDGQPAKSKMIPIFPGCRPVSIFSAGLGKTEPLNRVISTPMVQRNGQTIFETATPNRRGNAHSNALNTHAGKSNVRCAVEIPVVSPNGMRIVEKYVICVATDGIGKKEPPKNEIAIFQNPECIKKVKSAINTAVLAVFNGVRTRISQAMGKLFEAFVARLGEAITFDPLDALIVGGRQLIAMLAAMKMAGKGEISPEEAVGDLCERIEKNPWPEQSFTNEPPSFRQVAFMPLLAIYGSKLLTLGRIIGKIISAIYPDLPKNAAGRSEADHLIGKILSTIFPKIFAPSEGERNAFAEKFANFVAKIQSDVARILSEGGEIMRFFEEQFDAEFQDAPSGESENGAASHGNSSVMED